MSLSVLYKIDGEFGQQVPIWITITTSKIKNAWKKTIFFELKGNCEYIPLDEIENEDVLAVTVPYHVYTRHPDRPNEIGLHMPSLESYISSLNVHNQFSFSSISCLMMRVSDLQTIFPSEVRNFIFTSTSW